MNGTGAGRTRPIHALALAAILALAAGGAAAFAATAHRLALDAADVRSLATATFAIVTIATALAIAGVYRGLVVPSRRRVIELTAQRAAAADAAMADFDGSAVAMLALDNDDRVARANRAAALLFGWPTAGLQGMPLHQLLPEGAVLDPRMLVATRGRHASGDTMAVQVQRLPGAKRLTGHDHVMVLDVDEARRLRDETDRLQQAWQAELAAQAAELAQERDRAQAAARSKAEFLANMSHELRTPLNHVLGLAHLARQPARGEQARQLERLEEAASGLLGLLNDLLSFSRLEAGQVSLAPEGVDIRALVLPVARQLASQAQARHVELVAWIDAAVPPRLVLDRLRLRQVLLILLGNAVKFTTQGHVTLHLRRIERQGQAPQLRVEITDTGIGIDEATLGRIGRTFEQADAGSTRAQGGTGMGLAIAQRVLGLMGTRLEIRSQLGRGTTMAFELALHRAPVNDGDNPAWPQMALRVLVVDDLPDARAAMTAHLQTLGCDALAVADGASAILAIGHAEAGGQPFDACLVDDGLPAMPGQDLIGRLRGAARQRCPAIVRMRAVDSPEPSPATPASLAAVMLEQPAGPVELADAMTQAMSQAREIRPASHQRHPDSNLDIAGLDEALGLQRARHDVLAYRRLLDSFVGTHAEEAALLRRLGQEGAWSTAAALAHDIKTTAAAIGATQLALLAHDVADVRLTDPPPALKARIDAMVDALETLLEALRHHGIGASSTSTPVTEAEGRAADTEDGDPVEALHERLMRRDLSASRFVRSHEPALMQALGERLGMAVVRETMVFDYDQALELLRTRQLPATAAPPAARPALAGQDAARMAS